MKHTHKIGITEFTFVPQEMIMADDPYLIEKAYYIEYRLKSGKWVNADGDKIYHNYYNCWNRFCEISRHPNAQDLRMVKREINAIDYITNNT